VGVIISPSVSNWMFFQNQSIDHNVNLQPQKLETKVHGKQQLSSFYNFPPP
jgi:hypothetical protein